MPTWEQLLSQQGKPINVEVESPFLSEFNRFVEARDDQRWDELVSRYPIRETGAYSSIATEMGCRDRSQYERMLVARIKADNALANNYGRR